MIVYNKEEHREKVAEIVQLMGMSLSPMVAWETNDSGRIVHDVKLGEINNDTEQFVFKGVSLGFKSDTIFFYCKDQSVIFKTSLVSNDGNQIVVKIPDVMKELEEADRGKVEGMIQAFENNAKKDEPQELAAGLNEAGQIVDSFGFANNHEDEDWLTKTLSEHDANLLREELSYITLEEEDEMFADKRATPRAKPPEGKMITVQVENNARPQSTYMLYDLSQGGLSFLIFTQDEFSVGETVYIKAFDTKKFETPITSVVKAIREADQLGIQFKVGCEFVENSSEV